MKNNLTGNNLRLALLTSNGIGKRLSYCVMLDFQRGKVPNINSISNVYGIGEARAKVIRLAYNRVMKGK